MNIKVQNNGTIKVVTTPVEATSLWINEPSFEYDTTYGSYNMAFAMTKEDYEGSELEGAIQAMLQNSTEKAKKDNPKFKNQIKTDAEVIDEVDEDGELTGRVLIKCKQKGKREVDGQLVDRKVKIVDTKGNDASHVVATKGSIIRVSFTMIPWYMPTTKTAGKTCWLNSVQYVNPVVWEADDEFGDSEDDGWEAPVTLEQAEKLVEESKTKAEEPAEFENGDDVIDSLSELD